VSLEGGDIHEYVVAALQRQGRTVEPEQCFQEIRRIFVKFGVKPDEIVHDACIVSDLGID
jgi:hypothetical protein